MPPDAPGPADIPTPALVSIDPSPCPTRAAELARRLSLPLAGDEALRAHELRLRTDEDGLHLYGEGLHLHLDYVHGRLGDRLRRGLGRAEPLAKAVGLARHTSPRVLDLTAGLGRDGLLLAGAGCRVVAWERSPVLTAMVEEALERARLSGRLVGTLEHFELHLGEARSVLQQDDLEADVILLDPMFPERTKSALVRQEMRLLLLLLGADDDARTLMPGALARARRRVVVKRPRGAPPLVAEPPADLVFAGRTTRFDVYLVG